MSEQIIDLRSTWAILRRRARSLAVVVALGGIAGGVSVAVHPPLYRSTSIVLLPPAPEGTTDPVHSMDTQVEIAGSEAVLGPAGARVTPRLGAREVAGRVQVSAPAGDILRFTATGTTAKEAERLSEAVATSQIEYLQSRSEALGDTTRRVLSERAKTLKGSLTDVNHQIKKTQARLAHESSSSTDGKADAAALAQLTAQQANLVLQVDQVEKQAEGDTSGSDQSGVNPSLIQHASPGARGSLALWVAVCVVLGAAAAFVVAAVAFVHRGRRERTLRSRDDMADALGVPVAASVDSRAPRTVAGWTTLLQAYAPADAETWRLRQLLRLVTPGHPGSLAEASDGLVDPPTVLLLTLSDDVAALAVGPQLASFAASTGLRTRLVADQPHESANALWAACSGLRPEAELRPGLSVGTGEGRDGRVDLVVTLAVVDRARPTLEVRLPRRPVTLLAVTSGAATADELARVALAADDVGHPIARTIVVDPDPFDRTTGRLLAPERAGHASLPTLMTGSAITDSAPSLARQERRR